MKKDLVIVEKIENRLQTESDNRNVFPLSPTHRKELRELKRQNMGDIHTQLRTIKELKREEYKTKYRKELDKEFESKQKDCDILDKAWIEARNKVQEICKEFFELGNKHRSETLSINTDCDYDSILKYRHSKDNIKRISKIKREYYFDEERISNEILEKEFDKRFGKSFKKVADHIENLETKYEEAINFGDLNLVKEIYYILKSSDTFFEKIQAMEV